MPTSLQGSRQDDRRSFRCQLLANRGRTIADLVDGPLKIFLRDVEMSGPVKNLVRLVHVDLAAIGRRLSGEVVAHLYDTMTRRRRSAANFL